MDNKRCRGSVMISSNMLMHDMFLNRPAYSVKYTLDNMTMSSKLLPDTFTQDTAIMIILKKATTTVSKVAYLTGQSTWVYRSRYKHLPVLAPIELTSFWSKLRTSLCTPLPFVTPLPTAGLKFQKSKWIVITQTLYKTNKYGESFFLVAAHFFSLRHVLCIKSTPPLQSRRTYICTPRQYH